MRNTSSIDAIPATGHRHRQAFARLLIIVALTIGIVTAAGVSGTASAHAAGVPSAYLVQGAGEFQRHLPVDTPAPACSSGFLCAYVPDPNNSGWHYVFYFTKCVSHAVYNWYGTGGYDDHQTGSYTIRFYTSAWHTQTKKGYHATKWDPVNYIDPC